jgi:hypothetical protein
VHPALTEYLDHEVRTAVENLRMLVELLGSVDEPLEPDDAPGA